MSLCLNALITNLCESAQIIFETLFPFSFILKSAYNARQIPGEWFQRLEYKKQRTTSPLLRWADTQAHFLLHAHLMSPILSACHILFLQHRFDSAAVRPRSEISISFPT
ncbi:hypothetical protein ACP3P6_16210 [Enterobacter mori]